ncbi:hypothetical protein PHAMO_570012 [Magnetospirillum molischianum DSM 120]|uniref:Uncharacterized protein n=1 Tax=Magnetospirillum molischianum DSM 120 TaxID=1150626 RepID=H8FXC9_MAGML|nr:hypothetical protein PHAMO_570012 [Magnetospirillum molischianum DSM 120]
MKWGTVHAHPLRRNLTNDLIILDARSYEVNGRNLLLLLVGMVSQCIGLMVINRRLILHPCRV